ncbi:MAG: PGF-CTERM sorting domain-containing protein [archaeon]|nr:PGF-CTERM sorting domain-containing protein [archaeon]
MLSASVGASGIDDTCERFELEWLSVGVGYYAYSVQQTTDGGYVIGGSSGSLENCGAGLVIKTDSEGNEEWNRTFGGHTEQFYCVRQAGDDYVLVGETRYDVWLIKTDANGNELWNRTFGDYAGGDCGYSAQQTADGGYIITGETWSQGSGACDLWLIKTDSEGKEEWNRTFGESQPDWGNSVQQTTDGGYIVAGTRCDGNYSAWLIKTDSEGKEEWNRTFGGLGEDKARSVQQTADGGYVLCGETWSHGYHACNAWLIKTDSEGNEEWMKTYQANESAFYSVRETADGYIVGGFIRDKVSQDDIWLVKIDRRGNDEWSQAFGGPLNEYGRSVCVHQADGYEQYVILGGSLSETWIIKVKEETSEPQVAKPNYRAVKELLEKLEFDRREKTEFLSRHEIRDISGGFGKIEAEVRKPVFLIYGGIDRTYELQVTSNPDILPVIVTYGGMGNHYRAHGEEVLFVTYGGMDNKYSGGRRITTDQLERAMREREPPENHSSTTPTKTSMPTQTPEPPGFEAIFAMAGLLGVAYLVHKRKN